MWSVTDEPLREPETDLVSPGHDREPRTDPPDSESESFELTCPVAERPLHLPDREEEAWD